MTTVEFQNSLSEGEHLFTISVPNGIVSNYETRHGIEALQIKIEGQNWTTGISATESDNFEIITDGGTYETTMSFIEHMSSSDYSKLINDIENAPSDVNIFARYLNNYMIDDSESWTNLGTFQLSNVSSSVCYKKDTEILTDQGLVKVQNLSKNNSINDKKVIKTFQFYGKERCWIKYNKGCFGNNIPSKDVFVSPNHEVKFNNTIYPSFILANTIKGVERIYLDKHPVIYNFELESREDVNVSGILCPSLVSDLCGLTFD